MALTVGSKAPDFRLPGTTGDVALAEQIALGPTVIAFYPKDNTSG